MKTKRIIAALMASAMVMGLAACGGSSASSGAASGGASSAPASSGAAASGDESYNVSVILKTTSSEYWGYVVAGANAYAKDHPNVTVNVKGATSETAYDE